VARKKTSQQIDLGLIEEASEEHSVLLGQAFDAIIKSSYGKMISPKPLMTPTGIVHLDALLGGGFVSSAPIQLSSTPETGKSTITFQFSKTFLDKYKNAIVVCLDVEGSGNVAKSTKFQITRIETFGLDTKRFKYEPIMVNVSDVFQIIESLVEIKQRFEEKLNKEFYLLVIWDSIAATPPSKIIGVDDPNKIIGVKAREVTFCFDKYSPMLSFNRVSFMVIDQVRANIKIDGLYAPREQSVGEFKDYKAASAISAYNHRIAQWLFLSKGKSITPSDPYGGLDGWFLNISTEKNKFAPSKIMITCVFSKIHGIDKFWSEFIFLSELIPTEQKMYKNKKFPFYLFMRKSGAWVYLRVKDPKTGHIDYESDKFYKKHAKMKYNEDEKFRKWFDYAVNLSVYQRITNGLFKLDVDIQKDFIDEEIEDVSNSVEAQVVEEILGTKEEPIETTSNIEEEPIETTSNIEEEPIGNTPDIEEELFETAPNIEEKSIETTPDIEEEPIENTPDIEEESGYQSIF